MNYDNRLDLVIEVNPAQANAAFKSVNSSILGLETQMAASSRVMSASVDRMAVDSARGMTRSREEVTRASQAMQVLSTRLGLQLPEAANRFIASSRLMGLALTTISSGVMWGAIISSAAMLIGKLIEWGKESDEVRKRNEELRKSIDEEVKSLDAYYDRLDKIKRARGLIGLEGTVRGSAEVGSARQDMQQAQIERAALMEEQNRIALELSRSSKYRIVNGKPELTAQAQKLLADYETNQKALTEVDRKYNEAKETLKNQELELEHSKTQEIKKQQEERLRNLTSYVNQTRALEIAAIESPSGKIGAQLQSDLSGAGIVGPGVGAEQIAARKAALQAKALQEIRNIGFGAIKGVDVTEANLDKSNRQFNQQLDAEQKAYQDFIDKTKDDVKIATDSMDRLRKGEEDMAREAERAFERASNAIEGFIHRTFLTAKSFSDVWKQALAQVADFAVRQFARMAAAAWMGGGRSAPGQAMAGAGVLGIPSIMGNLGLGGGGAIGAAAGGGGGLGGVSGLAGMGLKAAGLSSLALPIIGGLAMGGSMVSNPAAKGGLYAAAGLGAISAAGASGLLGMGGYAMVASLSMPIIGAVIAAGVGIGMLISFLHKSATEKARQKIKSTYGVDIQSKGVLQQVVDLAKQSFGGNLDMAIRSNVVQELVRLYAMTTGQAPSGIRAPMTSLTMSQSGGSLSVLPSYSNGLPGSSLSNISAGVASGGGGIVIQLDGPATTKLLQGEAVNVINNNSRIVAASSFKATRGNYARRELTALQLAPGTIVS